MRILLLGTGGYHPNDRRETACIMIPELEILLDAGTAFYRVPQLLQTTEVDIFLTHAHLDHVVGLSFFLVPLYLGPVKAARVHGSPATLHAVQEHLFSDALFPVKPPYDYRELTPEVPLPGEGILTHIPQTHPGGSTGFKLTWEGRSFAYLTDTFADGSSVDFVRGVDLLIHECNFSDDKQEWAQITGHSMPTPVATLARDAGVGKLVVLHFDPQDASDTPIDVESMRKIFPQTELAEDFMELNI